MPIVAEIMSQTQLDLMVKYVDVLQVGARNMQNYNLLRSIGETRTTVLLKRGLSATIEELLMSAEYILAGGNRQVMLCERGIRTFETATRNTTDINAIPVLKSLTHLPVILDPSHSTGNADYVAAVARAAVAAGADGLIIEVHPDPPTRSPMANNRSNRRNSPNWSNRSVRSHKSWDAALLLSTIRFQRDGKHVGGWLFITGFNGRDHWPGSDGRLTGLGFKKTLPRYLWH